jgi:hypothetical protein
VEAVERLEPSCATSVIRRQLPVQQPERSGILQVGIPSLIAEESIPERTRTDRPTTACRVASVFLDDAGRRRPVPDGADHVLADTQHRNGLFFPEEISVFLDSIDRFFEPRIPERERVVSRKGMLGKGYFHAPQPLTEISTKDELKSVQISNSSQEGLRRIVKTIDPPVLPLDAIWIFATRPVPSSRCDRHTCQNRSLRLRLGTTYPSPQDGYSAWGFFETCEVFAPRQLGRVDKDELA